MPKSTKAVVQQRVAEIHELRLAGAEFWDIREYASAPEGKECQRKGPPWGVSDSQLWNYIKKSDELLEKTIETDANKNRRKHIAKRSNLYARALNSGDVRTALMVAKDHAELEGVYPAKPMPANAL